MPILSAHIVSNTRPHRFACPLLLYRRLTLSRLTLQCPRFPRRRRSTRPALVLEASSGVARQNYTETCRSVVKVMMVCGYQRRNDPLATGTRIPDWELVHVERKLTMRFHEQMTRNLGNAADLQNRGYLVADSQRVRPCKPLSNLHIRYLRSCRHLSCKPRAYHSKRTLPRHRARLPR